ncbi:MAG: hypothetical protein Q8S33_20065 [Myxococcales bacterium]|nr:hypothetical protein [Myxococcales bacterium]
MATILPVAAPTTQPPLKPWPLVAGFAASAIGLGLAVNSHWSEPRTSLRLAFGLALVWGLLELVSGAALMKRREVGTAHMVGGALTLSLAALLSFLSVIPAFELSPEPIVLLIGVSCACNAVFRYLDVLLLRPMLALPEALAGAVLFAVAGVALSSWRSATPAMVELLVGTVVFAGALALAGSANEASPATVEKARPGRLTS